MCFGHFFHIPDFFFCFPTPAQEVLHGPPRAMLGEDGGAVLCDVQRLHRKGLRQVGQLRVRTVQQ